MADIRVDPQRVFASREVIAVDQKPSRIRTARTSEFFELKLTYSSARTAAPSNCLMKVGRPELFDPSKKEVAFDELARGNEHSTGLLTTFGTAINDVVRSAVILMEDKSDAFYVTEWPLPPKISDCEQAVRSLAAIHATWWDSPLLESEGFDRLSRLVNLPDDSPRRLLAAFFDAVGMESPSHGVRSSSDCLSDIHKPSSNVSMKRRIRRRWSTAMPTFGMSSSRRMNGKCRYGSTGRLGASASVPTISPT